MSLTNSAAYTVTKASTDLKAALDRGPEPRELRTIAGDLFDAAEMLLQSAADIESGVES